MKTKLPNEIKSIEDAKYFLNNLYYNKEHFHPEDDAHTVIWDKETRPTGIECNHLNKLMNDIYALPGNESFKSMVFDPCEYILSLHN